MQFSPSLSSRLSTRCCRWAAYRTRKEVKEKGMKKTIFWDLPLNYLLTTTRLCLCVSSWLRVAESLVRVEDI